MVIYVTITNGQMQGLYLTSTKIQFSVSLYITAFCPLKMDKSHTMKRNIGLCIKPGGRDGPAAKLKIFHFHTLYYLSRFSSTSCHEMVKTQSIFWLLVAKHSEWKMTNMTLYESAMCQYVSGQDSPSMLG